jgi:tRNA uridine 5-carbamoylmethylation protein Kti12
MRKPICTVMVGLPALGKSSLLRFVDDPEFGDTVFVYSTDNFIEQQAKKLGTTYNNIFESTIKTAVEHQDQLLVIAAAMGVDVYWDQTNLTRSKRKKIINQMRGFGYNIECMCVLPPEVGHFDDLKVWKHRLVNRAGKTMPAEVITKMYNAYQEPDISEGFSRIRFYNMHGALVSDSGQAE